MAGMTTSNTTALIRANLWSNQLKDVLKDQLEAQKYVDWLSDFNDGTTLNIPSIGTMDVNDYTEDSAVQYTPLDTGNFQFSITEYTSSATYITNQAKQDLFYAEKLVAAFVPEQERALMTRVETDILRQGQPGTPNGQTAGNANRINGADHRWVGGATVNSLPTLSVNDFAKARYALKKANVPDTNLIAVVDPSVEFVMNTQTNLVNISNNPMWEGIVADGISTGMRFVKNIFGFDVYMSNYLPTVATTETINTVASGANSVANLFFSADSTIKPFVGAWRQMPKVDGEYNKDRQREEFVTTSRYGLKLYRPENFITVLSQPGVVA